MEAKQTTTLKRTAVKKAVKSDTESAARRARVPDVKVARRSSDAEDTLLKGVLIKNAAGALQTPDVITAPSNQSSQSGKGQEGDQTAFSPVLQGQRSEGLPPNITSVP